MGVVAEPEVRPGLRERKREATRLRIATHAARLATERGVGGVTTDQIADAAEISRATFFRYFDAKETAIAEGFSGPRVDDLLAVLAAQPADLAPLDALVATFGRLGEGMDDSTRDLVLEQARIIEQSSALRAWIASAYLRDEILVARVVAERMAALPGDLYPRVVGAIAMAAIRLGLEQWVAADGEADLTALVQAVVRSSQT